MSDTYRLTSWAMDVEFSGRPRHWTALVMAWFLTWLLLTVLLLWAFAFPFADWIGVERAALVGIALIILGVQQ